MGTHAVTRIRPVSKHRQRLVEEIGEESWVYDGIPVKGKVTHEGKALDVYLLEWRHIPAHVQQARVRSRAAAFGVSLVEARLFLESHPNAMLCADVELSLEHVHG